jgi:hypothetical protein
MTKSEFDFEPIPDEDSIIPLRPSTLNNLWREIAIAFFPVRTNVVRSSWINFKESIARRFYKIS